MSDVVHEKKGIQAVYTIPELLMRAERVEAELEDYRLQLAEEVKRVKEKPRFGAESYKDIIEALSEKASALRREAQNRARTPNQLIFDSDLGF